MLLLGLRVAVDVQHLFRPPPRHHDRGAEFRMMASGAKACEGDVSLLYAAGITHGLERRGATVLGNGPLLSGTYGARNRAAAVWGAHAYLACHLNAGGGSYALTEHMGMNPGQELGRAIGLRLQRAFGVITDARTRALHAGDRGAVCVSGCPARVAAVILEPLFGDSPGHQALMIAPRLADLGEAIALGVADWWVATHMETTPG
jgi:N-acetylmuramoyl-L-alanine amidase